MVQKSLDKSAGSGIIEMARRKHGLRRRINTHSLEVSDVKHKYTVIAEMPVKDSVILTLDSPRRDDDLYADHIVVDGKKTPYQLTHNETLIILKSGTGYLNKEITFC